MPITSHGYVVVKMRGHHLANVAGYVYVHRLVAEEKLGRRLRPGEVVHHIDGDKANNAPENLAVITSAEHGALHGRRADLRKIGEPNPEIECACGCGETLLRYDREGRPRRMVRNHVLRLRGERGRLRGAA